LHPDTMAVNAATVSVVHGFSLKPVHEAHSGDNEKAPTCGARRGFSRTGT
jgi:hypothetical protein